MALYETEVWLIEFRQGHFPKLITVLLLIISNYDYSLLIV